MGFASSIQDHCHYTIHTVTQHKFDLNTQNGVSSLQQGLELTLPARVNALVYSFYCACSKEIEKYFPLFAHQTITIEVTRGHILTNSSRNPQNIIQSL